MARISTKIEKKAPVEGLEYNWNGATYTSEQFMKNIIEADTANPAFSQAVCKMIDNKYGPIEIAGHSFIASEILKSNEEAFNSTVSIAKSKLSEDCGALFKSAKAGADVELPLYGKLTAVGTIAKSESEEGLHFSVAKSDEKAGIPDVEPYESEEEEATEETPVESVEELTEPEVAPEEETPVVDDEVLTEPVAEGTDSDEGKSDIPDAVVTNEPDAETDDGVPSVSPLEDFVETGGANLGVDGVDDITKMIMAKREKMQKESDALPGATQPYANNYRVVSQGQGKFNPVDAINSAVQRN